MNSNSSNQNNQQTYRPGSFRDDRYDHGGYDYDPYPDDFDNQDTDPDTQTIPLEEFAQETDDFTRRAQEAQERRRRQRQRTNEEVRRRQLRRERQIQQAKARLIFLGGVVAAAVILVLVIRYFVGRGGNGTAGAGGQATALTANAAVDTASENDDNSNAAANADGSATGNAQGEENGSQAVVTDVKGNPVPSEEQVAQDRAAKNYSAAVATFWPYDTFYTTDETQTIPTIDADNAADAPAGTVVSTNAIVVDADHGNILAQRGMQDRIVPASMTKVMTLLVAVETLGLNENSSQLHDMVTLTTEDEEYAYINESSAVCWMPGDTASVEDLMYGTILPSGADAAMALAEHTAGTADEFVKLMNQKAQELGIGDTTHFTNCVGVYDENHYSTVYDVAVIMKAALENDLCRKVLSEHTWTTSPTSEHPEGITVSNWFLRRIEDKDTHGLVLCAKTGYVNESGFCAVSYQESDDGSHLIVCTAASSGNWRCINDHVSLYQKYAKDVETQDTADTSQTVESVSRQDNDVLQAKQQELPGLPNCYIL